MMFLTNVSRCSEKKDSGEWEIFDRIEYGELPQCRSKWDSITSTGIIFQNIDYSTTDVL